MSLISLKKAVQVRHSQKPSSSSSSSSSKKTMRRSTSTPLATPSPWSDRSSVVDLDGNDLCGETFGVGAERRWLVPEVELVRLRKPRAVELAAGPPLKLYFAVLHLHPIDLTLSFKYMALQEAKDEDKEVFALGNMAQIDNAKVVGR